MPARVAYDALGLTPAEHDVVRLLSEGLLLKEVAVRRYVGYCTVRKLLALARERTGARTSEQLCAMLARAEAGKD
jgi:DNA-binding CsgD family transcriptional regulator